MAEPMRKDEAHELVEKMPENATWDDLIDEIYVRQVIEQGLADSQAGRTTDVKEVRRKYGLQE
jgi:DNA-binding transcriptional regulator YiaG